MKKYFALIIFLTGMFAGSLHAQYNPYLGKKKKNKPSAVMARQNKKDLKRQKKMAKKQMRRSKRKVFRKN